MIIKLLQHYHSYSNITVQSLINFLQPALKTSPRGGLRFAPHCCHVWIKLHSKKPTPSSHIFNPGQVDGSDKCLNIFPLFFGRYTCQAMLEENHSAHKLQKHSYICHSDTCRQNEHGLSHYQAVIEASCQVETHKSLLQMLQTISINSQIEGNRMSASISIRGKRKYLRGKHSNWIFDYKLTLPQGVGPLGSAWVYNLLSELPVNRFNYFTNMLIKIWMSQ